MKETEAQVEVIGKTPAEGSIEATGKISAENSVETMGKTAGTTETQAEMEVTSDSPSKTPLIKYIDLTVLTKRQRQLLLTG